MGSCEEEGYECGGFLLVLIAVAAYVKADVQSHDHPNRVLDYASYAEMKRHQAR